MQARLSNLPIRLLDPTFALVDSDGAPRRPTLREQVGDFFASVDCVRDRRRALDVVFEAYHVATLFSTVVFLALFATPLRLVACVVLLVLFGNVWNTVWYHRYCSHRAFTFANTWLPKVLLWLNPIGFREEIYALLHHPHHLHTDTSSDPYGPHLGVLGSYVASGRFRIETDLSEVEYARLRRFLRHVPIRFSSLATFRKWGSVEAPVHYVGRICVANIVWAVLTFSCAGLPGVLVWYTTVFVFTLLMRDFNYRGHGGGKVRHRERWDFDRSHLAVNQWFYGLIGSEWHNNHHLLPRSARNGFLPGQVDASYGLLRAMRRIGLVDRLNDHTAMFRQRARQSFSGDSSPCEAGQR